MPLTFAWMILIEFALMQVIFFILDVKSIGISLLS